MINKFKNLLSRAGNLFEDTNVAKEPDTPRKTLSKFLLLTSSLLLFLIFALFAMSAVTFIFGGSISTIQTIVSSVALVPFAILSVRGLFRTRRVLFSVLSLLLVMVVVVASVSISKRFYDLDYDSQWYHLEAVIALNNGWNPYRHELTPESDPGVSSQNILNSYPKAQEIIEANIYKLTGEIETAKAINLITTLTAFGFVLSTLLRFKGLNPILSFVGSLMLVVNPISLIQYLSAYVDGTMYNLTLSLVALFLTFYATQRKYILLLVALCIGILWNIKLTAVLYSTAFFATFLMYSFYSEKIHVFFRSIRTYILSSLVAILVLGFHPYVTNTLRYGDPFYSDGKSTEGYIYVNAPSSLYYMPPYQRFILSIFSKPAILRGEDKTHQLKLPFTVSQDELGWLIHDNTVGGFGSLFSGVFIISIIGALLIFRSKHPGYIKNGTLLLLFTLIFSSAFFPVSSYARFITPFWIFPCAVALYSLSERRLLPNLVGLALVITVFANNYLITREYITFNFQGTQQVKSELYAIEQLSKEKQLAIDFDLFRSNRVRFEEVGIDFHEQSVNDCMYDKRRVLSTYIPESKITLCYQF